MKKILFALAMLVFGASALQQTRADVSIDVFYDNLSGGNWIEVEGYGYGWQPDLAVNDTNWRPYADGYWAYTDDGWAWVSYEDFGWATYHYGRWANLADYGWTWFPGEDLDWGPAWVSWRTGGDYVGWAPLPPRGPGVVYGGRPIGAQVDIEFDIGPEYYNFCEVRYIGEPVLRSYIAPPVQNVTYINNTVNVTNITVKNNVVYNYGPNYEVLSAHSNRPIQRLNIERQSATNFSAAAKSGALTKVQGNKLVVAAPAKLAKAPPTAKPPTVKTKVAQPKLNRGWTGVANEAQLKQKIKTENPKNVPPPTRPAARAAGSPPPSAPGAAGTPAASPGKPTGALSPAATPRGIASPAATPRATLPPRGTPGRPGITPPGKVTSPAATPRATPPPRGTPPGRPGTSPAGKPTPEPGAPGRAFERARPTPPAPQPRLTPGRAPAEAASPGVERKSPAAGPPSPPARHSPPSGPGVAPEGPGAAQPPGRQRGRIERAPTSPTPHLGGGTGNVPEQTRPRPPGAPPTGAGPGDARGGRERGQGAYTQPGGPPRGKAPAGAERSPGQPERGKKKGEKETPPPRPQ
jgi:Family of unknown function (DUF6600)